MAFNVILLRLFPFLLKWILQESLKGNLHNMRKNLKIQLPIDEYMTRRLMSRHTTTMKNI
jgi:hypothetical protein